MSQEAVKNFATKVRTDDKLRQQIAAIDTRNRVQALAQVTQIARDAGFQFSADDAMSLIGGRAAKAGAELDLADLSKIAGGGEDGFEWQWGSE